MKPEIERELLLDWIPNLTTPALKTLIRLLQESDPRLIRGAFRDKDGGGCLAEWAARHHAEFRTRESPGADFLKFLGQGLQSRVVGQWDRNDSRFVAQLLRMLHNELRLRARRKPSRRPGTCSSSTSCSPSMTSHSSS